MRPEAPISDSRPLAVSRDELDFVVPARPPRTDNPARRKKLVNRRMEDLRRIFLDGLDHQIGLAHDAGFTYPSHEYVERDGETVKQMTYKTPLPWWFEENGTLYLRLNFGERTMLIPGKNPVIRVGKRSNLLPTLEALHILVDGREMDDVIEKMVVVSR
ncbi:hypothetical protein AAFN88_06545 [Pelagibius sp. CAU 1746]|uniref:hypothetical protein n=1 Tax=Pelagibius sp. CAU 1746 TaxID=3140370 RepID=UPI00325BE26D